ncbi:MAG: hypothetical protein ACXV8Y_04765 [Acidimicrobiia bacterium]
MAVLAVIAGAAVVSTPAPFAAAADSPSVGSPNRFMVSMGAQSANPIASAPVPTAGTQPQLNYHGGDVIEHAKVVAVVWGSGTYLPEIQSASAPSVSSFFTGVNDSQYFDWLSEYNTVSQSIGRGSFAGLYTIEPDPLNNTDTLDDATQIKPELLSQIAAGHLPAADADTLYFLFFRQGQVITSGSASSATNFCAYHGNTDDGLGNSIRYAVMPHTAAGDYCGVSVGWGNLENGMSHELIEAVTDPDVGTGPYGWYDGSGNEIADKCAYKVNGGLIGGDAQRYDVTGEWSNANHACIITEPSSVVSIGDASALEGNSGAHALKFPVTLSKPSTTSVTVHYRLSGLSATGGATKAPGVDFSDRGGATRAVTFPVLRTGQTAVQKTISVPVFADTTSGEGNETMSVSVVDVSPGWTASTPSATGTILDDDGASGVVLSTGDASISSGMIGDRTITLPLMLSQPAGTTVQVTYVVTPRSASPGTSQYSGEYTGSTTKTITFSARSVSKSITLKVFGDPGFHDPETFTVSITSVASTAAVTTLDGSATGTIIP